MIIPFKSRRDHAFDTPKALSWGITLDKGRRTGKDWLRGTLVNFEVKRHVILTPMVPPEFEKQLLETYKNPCPLPRPKICGKCSLKNSMLTSKNPVFGSKNFGGGFYRTLRGGAR